LHDRLEQRRLGRADGATQRGLRGDAPTDVARDVVARLDRGDHHFHVLQRITFGPGGDALFYAFERRLRRPLNLGLERTGHVGGRRRHLLADDNARPAPKTGDAHAGAAEDLLFFVGGTLDASVADALAEHRLAIDHLRLTHARFATVFALQTIVN